MSDFDFAIAQLRHAYAQLASESVVKQKTFADGLLAPAIRTLERIARYNPNGEIESDKDLPTADDVRGILKP